MLQRQGGPGNACQMTWEKKTTQHLHNNTIITTLLRLRGKNRNHLSNPQSKFPQVLVSDRKHRRQIDHTAQLVTLGGRLFGTWFWPGCPSSQKKHSVPVPLHVWWRWWMETVFDVWCEDFGSDSHIFPHTLAPSGKSWMKLHRATSARKAKVDVN